MKTKSIRKHDWPAVIQDWEGSGATIAEFCRAKDLAVSGFYAAKNKYGASKPAMTRKAQPKFVEVASPLPSHQIPHEPSPTLRITSKSGHVLEVFL